MKIIPALALAALVAAPLGAAPPTPTRSVDPLTVAPPAGTNDVAFPEDGRDWLERLAPPLRGIAAAPAPGQVVPVIVVLHEPLTGEARVASPEAADAIRKVQVAQAAHRFARSARGFGFEGARALSLFPIVSGRIPADALSALASLPEVRAIQLDEKRHPMRAEGGPLIRADQLRTSFGGSGNGIGVAVIDSGIDYNHPEFGSRVKVGYDYVRRQNDPQDDAGGHGTACAGIIGGSQGMAPGVHLWALKVFHDEDPRGGQDSIILEALNDCLAEKNSFEYPLRVVSMSLGGGAPVSGACNADVPAYDTVMSGLVAANIAIFVATGNDGCSTGIAYPACVSQAIAVGAVYDANLHRTPDQTPVYNTTCSGECYDLETAADKIICYSNSGSRLDILAPSECVVTPQSLTGGYQSCFNGTSAATPYAAGVAAQLFSVKSTATAAQLRSAMTNTGRAITDPRNGITRNRIDAVSAYQSLTGGGGTTGASLWVAASARAAGAGGSRFTTDLGILNAGTASTKPTIKLRTTTGATFSGQASNAIPPGGHALFADIVGQLTNNVDAVGSLEITADQTVIVSSRTFNTRGSETFGQGIDGVSSSDGLSTGQSGYITQLQQDAAARSNLGFLNMGSTEATVQVTLYDASGAQVGTYPVTIGAGQLKADNAPFSARFGRTNIRPGWAKVTVSSGSGIWAYGSVLDAVSSDPTTMSMKK